MNRLCIFGGTFNPPHVGHIEAARFVIETLVPDLLLWMPAGQPPHKPLPPGSPTPAQRMEICRLAIESLPKTELCTLEIDGNLRYTADTARVVSEQYRPKELWLCVGGDMLLSLEQWKRAEEIFNLCRIAALSREENERDALARKAKELCRRYNTEIRVLHNPVHVISSTEVRTLLPKNEGKQWLVPAVYEYLQREKLYGIEEL